MICFKRYGCFLGFLIILSLTVGCATKNPDSQAISSPQALRQSSTNGIQSTFSYLKVVRTNSTSLELQVAVRKLAPLKGKKPCIWLVAVTHIGESNYYSEIQQHLDSMNLVLFEGIKMSGKIGQAKPAKSNSKSKFNEAKLQNSVEQNNSDNLSSKVTDSIQSKLARSLGLAFQLEAIDYSKPNFENCDMDIAQLEKIFSKKEVATEGKYSEAGQEWEKLKGLYLGDSFASVIADLLLKFVGSSPRMSALMKIVFIETLSKIEGDLEQWEGMPDSMRELLKVLIKERNNVIIARLREVLPKLKKQDSVALFYGAAHMYDLEARVCKEFGYKPSETIWFKAFSVDGDKYGISEFEFNFVRRLVDNTIRRMKE